MYDNILIPVDGSEVSNLAAEQGFLLASKLGSKVTLLYALDIAVLAIPDPEAAMANVEVMREAFREHADKLMTALKQKAASHGVQPETLVKEGDVHDEIISLAKEKGVDLIVMGTHGRRGLNRLLLGSVAESVARRAHCAVLLIRPV
ncbi:MAG: universal stress protein [Nitrospirota bacterium]